MFNAGFHRFPNTLSESDSVQQVLCFRSAVSLLQMQTASAEHLQPIVLHINKSWIGFVKAKTPHQFTI